MADRAGLGFLGFIFGGVTAAVMLVAVTVVVGHVDGRFVLDAAPTQIRREPIVGCIVVAAKEMAPVGAILIFVRDRACVSLCAAAGCGDCDFHCTRLSPMIFIEVIAAWLNDA